jgi:hypothetical protein
MELAADPNNKHKISDPLDSNLSTDVESLQSLCNLWYNPNKPTKNSGINDSGWITIKEKSLAKLLLETCADEDKKKILDATINTPRTIKEIEDFCEIPQTSGYRKINSLIEKHFLIPVGMVRVGGNKMVKQYVSVLDSIKINIDKGVVTVKIKFSQSQISKTNSEYEIENYKQKTSLEPFKKTVRY